MKRPSISLIAAVVALAAGSAHAIDPPAIVPKVGTELRSRLQNRATVRIPGVDASKATRIRAGAKFDSSRIRLNANTNSRIKLRTGGLDANVSGSSRTTVETRQGEADQDRPGDPNRRRRPNDPQTGDSQHGNGGHLLLRSSVEFRNRLAEIEQMRDVAVSRSDIQLMQRADQLEHDLRLQYRAVVDGHTNARRLPGSTDIDATHRANTHIHNTIEQGRTQGAFGGANAAGSANRVEGDVRGQLNSGADLDATHRANVHIHNMIEQGRTEGVFGGSHAAGSANRVQGDGRGQLNSGADAGTDVLYQSRNQIQNRVDGAAQVSQDVQYQARARGESTTSAAVQNGYQVRGAIDHTGTSTSQRVRQDAHTTIRAGQKVQSDASSQVHGGTRSAVDAAGRTGQQGNSAVNRTQVSGDASAASVGKAVVQGPHNTAVVKQRTGANGALDASPRRVSAEGSASTQTKASIKRLPKK